MTLEGKTYESVEEIDCTLINEKKEKERGKKTNLKVL